MMLILKRLIPPLLKRPLHPVMKLRATSEPLVVRPWGNFKTLWHDAGYLVKRIRVHAGERLSLQRHKHRSEHWVVVQGEGTFFCDGRTTEAIPGVTLLVPCESLHRATAGKEDLVFIEVQRGLILSEEDIERLEDDYDRETVF